MGWNGSKGSGGSGSPVAVRSSRLFPWRGALAGLVVVGLVLAVVGFFLCTKKDSDAEDGVARKGMVGAVKPTSAKKPQAAPKSSLSARSADELLAKIDEKPPTPIKTRSISPEEWNRITNRVFKTGTEQLLSWVCQVSPGDMPMPIPRLDDEEKKNILGILISKVKVNETDDDKLASLKEDVNFAKKQMASYMAQGGDPDEFLQYYFQELKRAFDYRNEVRTQIERIYEDGDKELAREFGKKANAMLAERGIKTLPLSDFEDDAEASEEEAASREETENMEETKDVEETKNMEETEDR